MTELDSLGAKSVTRFLASDQMVALPPQGPGGHNYQSKWQGRNGQQQTLALLSQSHCSCLAVVCRVWVAGHCRKHPVCQPEQAHSACATGEQKGAHKQSHGFKGTADQQQRERASGRRIAGQALQVRSLPPHRGSVASGGLRALRAAPSPPSKAQLSDDTAAVTLHLSSPATWAMAPEKALALDTWAVRKSRATATPTRGSQQGNPGICTEAVPPAEEQASVERSLLLCCATGRRWIPGCGFTVSTVQNCPSRAGSCCTHWDIRSGKCSSSHCKA